MRQETRPEESGEADYTVSHLDPLRLMAQLPLRPYQILADLHCGSGHFIIPLAKQLYDGKVYASDSNPQVLEELKQELAQARLTNVVVFKPEEQKETISPETLDGALVAFTLHAEKDRDVFLQSTLGFLKKGGWVAVLEWYKKETPTGPPVAKRMDVLEVTELARKVGFRFSERRDLDSQHYMLLLRK